MDLCKELCQDLPAWIYCERKKIDQGHWDNFAEVVAFIIEKGFIANYKSRSGKYYMLDDHYYWTMGDPVEETTILNRAKLSEYKLFDNI